MGQEKVGAPPQNDGGLVLATNDGFFLYSKICLYAPLT